MEVLQRDVTAAELCRFAAARAQEASRHGSALPRASRVGAVALDGGAFVGCALAELYRVDGRPPRWAYLAELFVEAPYRTRGLGRGLLSAVEGAAAQAGARHIWTRTAEYEAPGFYARHGYRVTHTLQSWYPSGHGNVVLRKPLAAAAVGTDAAPEGVEVVARLPSDAELARTAEGFVEHGESFGNPPECSERIGFVAVEGEALLGFVSGLVRHVEGAPGLWCTLTDLFVARPARGQGVGSTLLDAMHEALRRTGVERVETWAPGFHAIAFMHERGYETRTTLEDWYPGGVARLALTARLRPRRRRS